MSALIRRVIALLTASERRKLWLLLAFLVLGAGAETLGIGLIYPIMDMISNPTRMDSTRLGQLLQPLIVGREPRIVITAVTVGLLIAFLLKNSFLWAVQLFQNKFVFEGQIRLSEELFSRRLYGDYRRHLASNTSEVLRVITLDTVYLFQSILMPILLIMSEALVAVMVVMFLLIIEPVATIAVLGAQIALAALFYFFVRDRVREFGLKQQAEMSQMIKWVNQGLGGFKENKVHHTESFFTSQFRAHAEVYGRAQRFAATLGQTPRLYLEVQAVSAIVMLCLYFAFTDRDLHLLAPTLAAFGMATVRLLPAANRILTATNQIRYYANSVDAVERECRSPALTTSEIASAGAHESRTRLEKIAFRDVTFRYDGRAEAALECVSFEIDAGSFVAILGRSGAGKTTAVDVLLGLLPPAEGEVLVNSKPIRNDVRKWQRRVGYVPQHVFLTDDSLRANITLGAAGDANASGDLERVVNEAQLSDLVRTLPQGLETKVGERGAQLSGGQCQRIGIARALYRNPDVLVLDEATSALDSVTEQQILRTILALKGKKTIVLITHRLSTVRNCDKVFFMKDGRLVGAGTLEQLAASNRDFQQILDEARTL